jgi:putative membrane protein
MRAMNWYLWLKALHVIAVISWMAALLYLPRLFVYHAEKAPAGSALSETFKIMESRLLRMIANPAMILVWLTGLGLAFMGKFFEAGWLDAKFLLVLGMSGMHGYLAKTTKEFARDGNQRSGTFFRKINEIPTILMIVIVVLVIVKPF